MAKVKVEFGSLSLENKLLNNFNNFGQVSDAFPMLKYSTMVTHSEKYIITWFHCTVDILEGAYINLGGVGQSFASASWYNCETG